MVEVVEVGSDRQGAVSLLYLVLDAVISCGRCLRVASGRALLLGVDLDICGGCVVPLNSRPAWSAAARTALLAIAAKRMRVFRRARKKP
jgi:hypothetical protein